MRRSLIAITCFFAGIGLFNPVHAQYDKIDFKQYELDNGLDVILHEDHSTPIVAVTVTYHVGSKNERENRKGFAHFFEHLMFEETKHIEKGKFGKIVQNAGGRRNASTSFDRTQYFEVLPSNQLKLGLWLESERMLHAKIDSQGVATQREVIKQEKNQRLDNQPYGTVLQEIFGHSYTEHPYQWTPIGTDQDINNAKVEEFREFYKTYYVPNNAVLSIAGDIKIKRAKKLIKQYFGPIPKGKKAIPRPDETEPLQKAETHDTVYDDIQLPAVIQSYHTPAMGSKDFYALDMLTTLLSDGKSSRMYENIVDEQELALTVNSSMFPLEDPGLFFVFGVTNRGVPADSLETAINQEIERVRKEGITDREFQKVQNQIEDDFYSGKNSVRGIATQLARYHLLYGNANLINTEIKRYKKVKKRELKQVANEYLVPSNRTVLYYLPKKSQASR
jgi:zinc protease